MRRHSPPLALALTLLVAGCGFIPAALGSFPSVSAFGGRILKPVRVVTITTAGDPLEADLEDFGRTAMASDWWQAISLEYALGPPADSQSVKGPALGSTYVSGSNIVQYIEDLVASGAAPNPDGNSIYLLYLPENAVINDPAFGVNTDCNTLKGYHDLLTSKGDGFAVIQRCVTESGAPQLDDLTTTASHEIAEAATDPSPGSGWAEPYPPDPPWTGSPWLLLQTGEVGDLCEGTYVREGKFLYQRIWSNHAASDDEDPCIPITSTAYYSASPDKPWYSVKAGEAVDIDLTGWSTSKTDDWEIRAKLVATSDPTTPFGVQLVSQTHALVSKGLYQTLNNGRTATLTVTAPPNAATNTMVVIDLRSFREQIVSSIPANGVLDVDLWHDSYVGVHVE